MPRGLRGLELQFSVNSLEVILSEAAAIPSASHTAKQGSEGGISCNREQMYALSKGQRDHLHLQEFEDFKLTTLLEATFDKEENQNPGGSGACPGHTANPQGSWD